MKNILPLFLCLCSACAWSQTEDVKRFTAGISVSAESQILSIETLRDIPDKDPPVWSEPRSAGFGIGAFGRWRLFHFLAFQQELQLAFTQNTVHFEVENQAYTQQTFHFADLEAPFHFVVTNQLGRLPLRSSFLFGGRLSWNVAQLPGDKLQLLPERLGLDIGLGVEVHLPQRWVIQPEVVYSHGINNLHDVVNLPYDWQVGRVLRDRISLCVLVWRKGGR